MCAIGPFLNDVVKSMLFDVPKPSDIKCMCYDKLTEAQKCEELERLAGSGCTHT